MVIFSMNFKFHPIIRFYLGRLTKKNVGPRYLQTIPNVGNHLVLSSQTTSVNEKTIKDTLEEFSLPYVDGYTCFHVKDCKMCVQKCAKSSWDSDIYINKKTGFFLCEQCKVTGSWSTFNEMLNKAKNNSHNEVESLKDRCSKYNVDVTNWKNIVSETQSLSDFNIAEIEKILLNFKLVKVSKKSLEVLKVRINKAKDTLYFPITCSGSDVVGYRTLNLEGSSTMTPKSDCSGCLIYPRTKNQAVVVANIPDFFALLSQKLPYHIICLPYGGRNLPQSLLPFLEKFDKMVLWLGLSDTDLDTCGNFCRKLIDRRCYLIRPIKNHISVEKALAQGEDIKQIVEKAKPTWHDHIITFNNLRDEVLAQLQNKNLLEGVQFKKFPELNKIIRGHRRGELTIITGQTGVGKTTFMSEYSLDLAEQGVNTLWGSFEIKNSRLAKVMLQQFAEQPLNENLSEFNSVADEFEQLPIFFMTFHGQQSVSTVMDAIEHCFYTYDIAHVIIDNIQFMIDVSPKVVVDRFWKQDYLIQCFRNFATKSNCHVTLVMHPRKENDTDLSIGSIFGGAKAGQEADNVLIIQNRYVTPNRSKKYLQVCKNRFSGDLGSIPLNFNKELLSFSKKNYSESTFEEKYSKFQENYGSSVNRKSDEAFNFGIS